LLKARDAQSASYAFCCVIGVANAYCPVCEQNSSFSPSAKGKASFLTAKALFDAERLIYD
jgi:hypothetical protein